VKGTGGRSPKPEKFPGQGDSFLAPLYVTYEKRREEPKERRTAAGDVNQGGGETHQEGSGRSFVC